MASFFIRTGYTGKPRRSAYGCHCKCSLSEIRIKLWSLHVFRFRPEFPEMMPLELPCAHGSLRVLLRSRFQHRRSGEEPRFCTPNTLQSDSSAMVRGRQSEEQGSEPLLGHSKHLSPNDSPGFLRNSFPLLQIKRFSGGRGGSSDTEIRTYRSRPSKCATDPGESVWTKMPEMPWK